MCGIAGFVDHEARRPATERLAIAERMAWRLRHRGPDDGGVWMDEQGVVALGHRRLSIIDPSPAGHQPMISSCGRYVIAYNGEVYNHDDIRPDLAARGVTFRSRSDTEVVLEACAAFGVASTVKRLVGMFAFALYDRQTRSLTLARDRLGVKPLYWTKQDDQFLFGSELKALAEHPDWRGDIDRAAMAAYLRHNYVPGPRTIYRDVAKLPPGTILTLDAAGAVRVERFWDPLSVARDGLARPLALSDREAVDRLEALLLDAVGRRMVADVPLGVFLSGGIDSALVTALMQAQSDRPVKSFSIGFAEASHDETGHAKEIARHLGTEHTEYRVTPADALAVVANLPEMFDEPFADPSQIPTVLLSAVTRQHVTVSLSGDGGDELFAGYDRYVWASRIWAAIGWMPARTRSRMAALVRALPPTAWDRLFAPLPASGRHLLTGDRLHKLAEVAAQATPDALYRRLVSHWDDPAALVSCPGEAKGALWDDKLAEALPDWMGRMQFLDQITYLPDDILVKVDRASMAASLEARTPLLDHRVAELAWRLPRRLKRRNGKNKWALRQVLYRYVPPSLVERPKMGFGVPIDSWLGGPLRDWAEDLLDESRLKAEGLLDPGPVRAAWAEHLSGRRNWQYRLWTVLMLEAWLRTGRKSGLSVDPAPIALR